MKQNNLLEKTNRRSVLRGVGLATGISAFGFSNLAGARLDQSVNIQRKPLKKEIEQLLVKKTVSSPQYKIADKTIKEYGYKIKIDNRNSSKLVNTDTGENLSMLEIPLSHSDGRHSTEDTLQVIEVNGDVKISGSGMKDAATHFAIYVDEDTLSMMKSQIMIWERLEENKEGR